MSGCFFAVELSGSRGQVRHDAEQLLRGVEETQQQRGQDGVVMQRAVRMRVGFVRPPQMFVEQRDVFRADEFPGNAGLGGRPPAANPRFAELFGLGRVQVWTDGRGTKNRTVLFSKVSP